MALTARIVLIVLGLLALLLAGAWILLRRPDIPYAALDDRYANAQSRWLDLPGGVRVHYRDQGRRGAPVLVMVHGYGASLEAWEPWISRLGADYRVVSLDLPGHGLTRAPASYRPSIDDYAELTDQLAQTLKLGPYVAIGNSMGGAVAWHIALRHPTHVRGLVLVDSAGWPDPSYDPKNPPLIFKLLMSPVGRAFLSQVDTRPMAKSGLLAAYLDPALVTPELIDRYVNFSRAPGHRAILINIQTSGFGEASPAVFRSIAAPTLVMHGEKDRMIPVQVGRDYAAAIPGAQLVIYPGVGHVPMEQIPDQSVLDLRAFLSRLPSAP